MAGHDTREINDISAADAGMALVAACVAGAQELDTDQPDGGELAAAMVYLATVADPSL